MLKIIKERTPVTVINYAIDFEYKDDTNAGFCFPTNADGTPAFDKMTTEAKANYERCLTDDRLTEAEFKVGKYMYMDPAIGQCTCGREVVLDSNYYGAVGCECGKWYNLFGQELKDPKYWEEDYEY